MNYYQEAYPATVEQVTGANILPRLVRKYFLASNNLNSSNNLTIDTKKLATIYLRNYMTGGDLGIGTRSAGETFPLSNNHSITFTRGDITPSTVVFNQTIIAANISTSTTFTFTTRPTNSAQVLNEFAQVLAIHNNFVTLAENYNNTNSAANLNTFNRFFNAINASNLRPLGWSFQGDVFFNNICDSINSYRTSIPALAIGGAATPPLLNATVAQLSTYTVSVYNATQGMASINNSNGVVLNGSLLLTAGVIPASSPLVNIEETTFNQVKMSGLDFVTGYIDIGTAFKILRSRLP